MTNRGKVYIAGLALLLLAVLGGMLWFDSRAPVVTNLPLEKYVPPEAAQAPVDLWPARRGSRWGYINRAGEFAIQPQFDRAYRFQEGLAGVVLDGKIGYLDKTGRFALEPRYLYAVGLDAFSEGRAGFQDGVLRSSLRFFGLFPRKGYLDVSGNKVIDARFRSGGHFHEGLAWVVQSLWFPRRFKSGFIDRQGNLVIGYEFDEAKDFAEGFAPVRKERKWFFVDPTGRPQFAQQFDYAHSFAEGLAAVKVEGRYGFIDKTGQWAIKPFYDAVEVFSEGWAAVKINRQWGFIAPDGKMPIPLEYRSARGFKEGLAAVLLEEQWGFINKDGKLVIPAQFDEAFSFQNGAALVMIQGEDARRRSAYIDKTGKVFWQEE